MKLTTVVNHFVRISHISTSDFAFPKPKTSIIVIKTSCSSNQRYSKRRAEHESESDTVKIRKKSRGVPNVGFLNRETDDNQHVRTSPFTFDKETRRYPLPTLLVESIIKEDSRVIGSGIGSVDSYFNKFNKTRSELSQNLQEAQIKLKVYCCMKSFFLEFFFSY